MEVKCSSVEVERANGRQDTVFNIDYYAIGSKGELILSFECKTICIYNKKDWLSAEFMHDYAEDDEY